MSVLSSEERQRAQRLAFPHLRRHFLAAHGAMRRILAEYAQCPPAALRFAASSYGKPFLPDCPRLAFNLSHSGEVALLGVAQGSGSGSPIALGVDIELCRPGTDFPSISARYFSAAEQASLPDPQAEDYSCQFMRLWTRKEAVTKCLGTGLRTPLSHFTVPCDLAKSAQVIWHRETPSATLFVRELDINSYLGAPLNKDVYASSLCASVPPEDICFFPPRP